jgi:hypothetical protein
MALDHGPAMGVHRSSLDKVASLVESLGPGPWVRDQLVAAGWSAGQLERAVARGSLVRLRRGLYVVPRADEVARQLAIPLDLPLARMRAVARSLDPSAAFSHDSAGHAHGLWNPRPCRPLLHVTIPGQSERQSAGVLVHSSALPAEFVTLVDGVRVTTVPRTAVDLARLGDLPAALVVMDGALRHLLSRRIPDLDRRLRAGSVPPSDVDEARQLLSDAFDLARTWPGARTVRAGIALADPASASPFESWSRGWMVAVGLPRPELNATLLGSSGRCYVGDFVWREHRLVGEADGIGEHGASSTEIRAALRSERERQADLEAAGWRVVRWTTGDPGAKVVARIGRALYLGRRSTASIPGNEPGIRGSVR